MKNRFNCLKDRLAGSYEELSGKYRKVFLRGDFEEKIDKSRKDTLNMYLLVILCFFILLSGYILGRISYHDEISLKNGEVVSIERPEDGSSEVELDIGFLQGDKLKKEKVVLNITAPSDESEVSRDESIDEGIITTEDLINEIKNEIEDNPSDDTILLPQKLSNGESIRWYAHKDYSFLLILILTGILFYLVYKSRFNKIKAEEKKAEENIRLELPNFVNKCVLLLNGGLVLTDALERIIYQSRSDTYFYRQLRVIYDNYETSNSSIELQLHEFAKNSGVREFIRITGIISDNVSKGVFLVEKLEAESESLWFDRKKKAEELGKLAETKLTLPMMILLVILIAVTIAPAMLQM